MDGWRQVTDGLWRKEADLPIGEAVAEIRKRDYVAVYDTRVAVTFAGPQLPHTVAKTAIAMASLPEAARTCEQLLADLHATRDWGWGDDTRS